MEAQSCDFESCCRVSSNWGGVDFYLWLQELHMNWTSAVGGGTPLHNYLTKPSRPSQEKGELGNLWSHQCGFQVGRRDGNFEEYFEGWEAVKSQAHVTKGRREDTKSGCCLKLQNAHFPLEHLIVLLHVSALPAGSLSTGSGMCHSINACCVNKGVCKPAKPSLVYTPNSHFHCLKVIMQKRCASTLTNCNVFTI